MSGVIWQVVFYLARNAKYVSLHGSKEDAIRVINVTMKEGLWETLEEGGVVYWPANSISKVSIRPLTKEENNDTSPKN